MLFIAEINHLQGAENLPYKEYCQHHKKPLRAKFEPLRTYRNARMERATQRRPENTRGEPPKIASEPPDVPPHIFTYTDKKKTPTTAKKPPQA